MKTKTTKTPVDLGAFIRDARRNNRPHLFIIDKATTAQRRQLLEALVDGWGIEDTLKLLSQVPMLR
jgi:hypothetical protein